MDLNGFKYHYVDEGRGEPIVMVHGNPTWSFYFRDLIKALSEQYRVMPRIISVAAYRTNPTAKPMIID